MRCRFEKTGLGWGCTACGRVVKVQSLKAPMAECGGVRIASIAPTQFPPPPEAAAAPTSGPGTELKKLLRRVGIVATPNCSCNARAHRMDEEEAREPGWCEAHLDEIVGWMREEAEKRKLPFMDMAGRLLVRRAIRLAKKS